MRFDPEHPLHRASFYIEDLKWGTEQWGFVDASRNPRVEGVDKDEAQSWIQQVLADAGLDLDPAAFDEAVDYYSASFARLGVQPLIARTLFLEGVLMGVAVKAGLAGEIPETYKP